MTTTVSLAYSLPATPDDVFDLLKDRDFVVQRLSVLEVTSSDLEEHDVTDDSLKLSMVMTMPRSTLPKAVRGFVRGEPGFRRTEVWRRADDGYRAEVVVDLFGTPSDVSGEMLLRPAEGGSRFTFDSRIQVQIPVFGGQVEGILQEQITDLADREAAFTREHLSR